MSDVVVTAAGTGAGKTLVTRALCSALRRAGRRIQPYKIGPDYIDGRLTARSAGVDVYNVDLWLDGPVAARTHVAATRRDAEVCIFEGMMGLYDGDDDGTTSTAGLALLLDLPVLIVLDGWTASQTVAAVALGLCAYEPRLRIAGAVLNRAGGDAHVRAVRSACARAGVELLAAIPQDPAVASFERQLGLDRADAEGRTGAIDRIGEHLATQIDLDVLFPRSNAAAATNAAPPPPHVRVAVAEDEAFWFTYPETLLALRAAGAEVVPFSPLRDAALPNGVSGLWLGGGYPELHAKGLADNEPMRRAVRDAVRAGIPTYAECGGMMYLGETLVTPDGEFFMCGALRGTTSIAEPRLTIGYRTARVLRDEPLDAAGRGIRGYEFRYASGTLDGDPAYGYDGGSLDGVASPALCASFLHRHFTVGDAAVVRFVATCAR